MKKYSKRFNDLRGMVKEETYSFEDAISMLQTMGNAKFVESVEAHIALNIDPKYANQQLRTSLVLPNGTGKELRIAVLTDAESVKEALDCGANIAGAEDLIEEMGNGNLDFDILITTPQMMPKLAKLGRVLGPKGLMPSPKSGTVTQNIPDSIREFQKGKLEYRADKNGVVHLSFGKKNFSKEQLAENLLAVYNSIEKNKPSGVKGKYFRSFSVCTTMSPGLFLEINSFKK